MYYIYLYYIYSKSNLFFNRIETLEKSVQEKDIALQTEKGRFLELKEHFKYNYKLLDERDRELEKYDATYAGNHSILMKHEIFDCNSIRWAEKNVPGSTT